MIATVSRSTFIHSPLIASSGLQMNRGDLLFAVLASYWGRDDRSTQEILNHQEGGNHVMHHTQTVDLCWEVRALSGGRSDGSIFRPVTVRRGYRLGVVDFGERSFAPFGPRSWKVQRCQ